MRRALLIVLLALIALPATAHADAGKLHGSWKLAAVAVRDMRVEVPPTVDIVVDFDKQRKSWTLHAHIENDNHEATGSYRVQGNQLILGFKGQEAPPVEFTVKGQELHVTMSLPEGERYTIISKRTGRAKTAPPPARPRPIKPAPK